MALERDANFGDDLPGVHAWGEAAFDTQLAEAVREHLLRHLEDDHPVQGFLSSASVDEVQERLFRRFTWSPEQRGVDVVEQSVLDRLTDELARQRQPARAAQKVKIGLFAYCWKQILKESPAERRLDAAALRQQIEAATTVTLELPVAAAGGLVLATAQLHTLQERFASLALLQTEPPEPPRALLHRNELVERVCRLVRQRSAVLLTGTAFKGKTTLARVVARAVGLTAAWTELAQRSPAAISETLKLLALTVDRPDGTEPARAGRLGHVAPCAANV
ncbi:MAG: hypothetical protein MZW92_36305 [Comamonadaceae bacterium]|nr:hypothetical protein [Comamonadaceae bacterium]